MSEQFLVTCICGHQMQVGQEHYGRTGKCRKCSAAITINAETVTPTGRTSPTASKTQGPSSAQSDDPARWKIGDVILDEYEVTRNLGEGGMGTVLKVHHLNWDLDMAVKSPKPEYFRTQAQKESFVRECHAWMDLGLHPHIVTCHYVRVLGGVPRIFAEYIDGGSLKDWIRDRRLYEGGKEKALKRILDIAIQFAWGLHYAHEKGLIHQDVKPDNVMLTVDGVVKVTDFGLANARAAADATAKSQQGLQSIMASYGGMTPAYCSPEQADNAARHQAGIPRDQLTKLTRRTDIYSWAVSVLEMFAGDVFWMAGNVVGQALKSFLAQEREQKDLPNMPKAVAELLLQCLQSLQDARPKSMEGIAEQLKAIYRDNGNKGYTQESPSPPTELSDVLNNKALSFLELGNAAEAERLWAQAQKLDPNHAEVIYNLGLHEWRLARIADDEVVRRMDDVQKRRESDWRDKYLLGLVHLERGDGRSALDVLEVAERQAVDSPDVRNALAEARVVTGRSSNPEMLPLLGADYSSSVAFSPDCHYVVSASMIDSKIRLWEVASGELSKVFEGHRHPVISLAYSPDGRFVLSSSQDLTVRLWDVKTGFCLIAIEPQVGFLGADSVALSPDARFVLTGGKYGELQFWDKASGACVRTFQGHSRSVQSVVYSADDRFVLSGSDDKTARLWDVASGMCMQTLEMHTNANKSLALSPDGRFVLSGSDDHTMGLWDVASGTCVRTFRGHTSKVNTVAFSPDGRYVLSGSADCTVRLWNVANGVCRRTFRGHMRAVISVVVSPDGRYGLSGGIMPEIWKWDLGPDRHRHVPLAYALPATTESTSNHAVAFATLLEQASESLKRGDACSANGLVGKARHLPGFARSQETLNLQARIGARCKKKGLEEAFCLLTFEGQTSMVNSVAFSPDGRYVLSGGGDETIRLWDPASKKCMRTFQGNAGSVQSVAFAPDGRHFVSGSERGKVQIWDVVNGECLRTFEQHAILVNAVAYSPDGRYVVAGSLDSTVRLWDVSSAVCLRTFEAHTSKVNSVAFSPDGRYVLSGGGDETIRLWDPASGKCVRTFQGSARSVHSVAFAPGGRYVLSGSERGKVQIWDVVNGGCLRTFEQHAGFVNAVAYSPDGRYVAAGSSCAGDLSGSNPVTVRLWDAETGNCLRTFAGHPVSCNSLAFSPDGRHVLFGGRDKTLQLWEFMWEYEFPVSTDWDEGARPYLENYLSLCTPYAAILPTDRKPSEEEIQRALTRVGRPNIALVESNLKRLLHTLSYAGYGWLRPEGVRKELEKMAVSWDGPPPLIA